MGCTLLTIPIALSYLGAERYGVWMTLTSAVGMLSFFDFGIGIGLQNRVAAMMGRGQLDQSAACLRSALVALLGISLVLFGLLALAIVQTGWAATVFSGAGFSAVDLKGVLLIIAGAFVLGLPLGLFSRMAFGVQQGWIAGVATSSGSAFTLIAVVAAARFAIDFNTFVALTVIPPIAAQGVGFFLLTRRIPGLSLVGPVDLRDGVRTLREGSKYVLPQIAAAVLAQSPLVLLGTLSSPVHAAIYSVLSRLSLPFQQLQQMFLDQVWPAITEALHGGDTDWLRRTLRRLLRSNLAFGAIAFVAVVVAVRIFYPLLTRSADLAPSLLVVLLFASHVALICVVQGLAYIANGLARLRLQTLFAVICVISVFTVLPFATSRYGLEGLIGALLVLNGFVAIPLLYAEYALYLRRGASDVLRASHSS